MTTFPFKSNIMVHFDKSDLNPQAGDELVFCSGEDAALASYLLYRGESDEPIEDEFLTDIFKKELVDGKISKPTFVGMKMFGFFGCRTKTKGRFFLYETEFPDIYRK